MYVRMYVRSSMYGHLYVRRDMRKQPNVHTWTPQGGETNLPSHAEKLSPSNAREITARRAPPFFPLLFYFVLSLSLLACCSPPYSVLEVTPVGWATRVSSSVAGRSECF